jgi:8-oxo-dGTP diphosphatase
MRKVVRAIIINDQKLLLMKRNKFGDKYYNLIGGGIDRGETAEQALVREIREETTLEVTKYRQVFTDIPGKPYGPQYVYLCDYPGGEAKLSSDSIEAKISKSGKNLYDVIWLPLKDLRSVRFPSALLKVAIVKAMEQGFPQKPITLNHSDYKGEL